LHLGKIKEKTEETIDWGKIRNNIAYQARFGVTNLWWEYVQEPIREKRRNELVPKFIEYQFKLAGVNMNFKELLEYQKEDKEWFNRFTLTPTQNEKVEKYVRKLFKKAYPGYSKLFIDKGIGHLILNYGLRVERE
jgi:hydroxymethylpyrimidine pyrophosphatase-like HAD family hydrolase